MFSCIALHNVPSVILLSFISVTFISSLRAQHAETRGTCVRERTHAGRQSPPGFYNCYGPMQLCYGQRVSSEQPLEQCFPTFLQLRHTYLEPVTSRHTAAFLAQNSE